MERFNLENKPQNLIVDEKGQIEINFEDEQSKDVPDTIKTEGLVAKGEKTEPTEPNIQEIIKKEHSASVTKDNEREDPGWDDWGRYKQFIGKMNLTSDRNKKVSIQEEKKEVQTAGRDSLFDRPLKFKRKEPKYFGPGLSPANKKKPIK